MKCPRCSGLIRVGVHLGDYDRCFQCGYHNWSTPIVQRRRKRRNIMRVRYAKSGKVPEFKDKILRVQVLPGSETRSRSNPTLIGSCPYKCDNDTETISYNDSVGYKLRCSRGHIVTVRLSLEEPIWR